MAKRRAHRIRLSLADALDLLVVSVEAGLGLDQAMSRVGAELAFAYPELSDELRLINLELRAGKPRAEALRNLADRTGVDDLSSLVTMLIQTDKFGTSVAQSLRVLLGDAAHQAPSARRGGGGEDGREDGVPARLLHLPGDLGRDDRSGGHQVHHRAVPDDREHEEIDARARGFSRASGHADGIDSEKPAIREQSSPIGRGRRHARDARGRPAVTAGSRARRGLWIVPSRGVHTCGMRFAIDVVALDDRRRRHRSRRRT